MVRWDGKVYNFADSLFLLIIIRYGCCIVICWFMQKYTYIYIYILDTYRRNDNRRMTNDRRTKKGRKKENAGMKDAWRTSLTIFLPLPLLKGFERVVEGLHVLRMLETERKLHILTPLLWPSRCVFLVLLDAQPEVLGSTPSGLFRGPPRSGVAFPTTSGLYCLEVCWQLL